MNIGSSNDRRERRILSGPYVGPRPFRTAEADRFFGRSSEALDLGSSWPAERVTVLHGRPGVGKTSLLNAGVLPQLAAKANVDLLPVGRLVHQAARPVVTSQSDNAYRYTLLSSWAPFGEPPGARTTVREFLASRPGLSKARGEPYSVLAAIDQFEEIFTAFPARDDEREQLIDELGAAVREIDAFNLLLILRDDHLGTLSRYEDRLSPYDVRLERLDALDAEAAMEAVTGPLEGTGRSFDPDAARGLVDRLRTTTYTDRLLQTVTLEHDRVEPLDLQIACANLWSFLSSLPERVELITEENLQTFGDPGQAVAEFYDAAVRDVSRGTGTAESDLREWIESTFVTEWGTRGTALRGIAQIAGMPNKVADALADVRILTPEYRNQSTWYQLGQDRLIDAVRRANRAWRAEHRVELPEPPAARTPADFRDAAEAAIGTGDFTDAHRFIDMAIERYRAARDTRGTARETRLRETRRLAHALELKGEIARVEGDVTAATRSLQEALREFTALGDDAAQARVLSALGEVYRHVGEYTKAIKFHEQANARLPVDVDTLTGLGYAQRDWGSPADADATFTRALGWNRNKSSALAGRGQARVDLREYRAALEDLDRAIMLGLSLNDEIDARSARALALASAGPGRPKTRAARAPGCGPAGSPLCSVAGRRRVKSSNARFRRARLYRPETREPRAACSRS